MAYTIENNKPTAGCIRWSGLNMQYNGQSYDITDGYTNATYAYWTISYPNNLVVTNTYPSLGVDDCLVFLNKNGIATVVPGATALDGALIVPGTVLADAIAANSITGDKIAAGAISANQIAANAVGAAAIAAGAVTADKIAVENLLALAAKIGDWEIGEGIQKSETHPNSEFFDPIDNMFGTKIDLIIEPNTFEYSEETDPGHPFGTFKPKTVIKAWIYPIYNETEAPVNMGYGKGFGFYSNGKFYAGYHDNPAYGGHVYFDPEENTFDLEVREIRIPDEVQYKRTTGTYRPLMLTNDAKGRVLTCDTGWLSLPLASGISAHSGTPQYRKSGNTVEVRAILKSTSALGGSYTEVTIATLPAGYRPAQKITAIMHAYNYHYYKLTINTNGTLTVSQARSHYTAGSFTDIPVGGNIDCFASFLVG